MIDYSLNLESHHGRTSNRAPILDALRARVPRARAVVGRAEEVPLASGSVDLVTAAGSLAGDVVTVEGTVRAAPDTRPGRVRIEIATTSIDAPRTGRMVIGGAVLVSIAGEEPAIGDVGRGVRYGTSVRITGTLDDDLAYQDPGVEPLRNSLIRRGLDASIRARPDGVAITGSGTFCPVLAALFAERERWLAWLDAHFEPRTNGLLRALLLGDGSRLDEETSDVYRRSGTFHVLVISGAHMGIVAVCLLWPVGRMSRGRWLRLAAGAVPVWAYSLMVGLPAPVMRAALAVTIALAARAVHRPAPPANTLALAALAVLAWDPRELDDPGFQLTFAAVAAITLHGSARRLREAAHERRGGLALLARLHVVAEPALVRSIEARDEFVERGRERRLVEQQQALALEVSALVGPPRPADRNRLVARLQRCGEPFGGPVDRFRRRPVDDGGDHVVELREGLDVGDLVLAPGDVGRHQPGRIGVDREFGDGVIAGGGRRDQGERDDEPGPFRTKSDDALQLASHESPGSSGFGPSRRAPARPDDASQR